MTRHTLPRLGLLLAAALAAALTAACENNPRAQLDTVPPPPAFEPAGRTSPFAGESAALEPTPLTPAAPGTATDPGAQVLFEPLSPAPQPNAPAAITDQPTPAPRTLEPVQAPTGRTYTVQKGDTLWQIAKRHYGSGMRWTDIADANPNINPNKLSVGQEIILP